VKPISRLTRTPHEKVWGSPNTNPWYENPEGRNIGEIWFAASDSVPLLVKLLFTSDNLSVQVHPEDDYAGKHHDSCGKTEMWYILRAEPGAKIALGLKNRVSREELRDAALTGEIMNILNWIPVRPGDTFFVPAGTIHAIGGGIALCEVQQYSDITYRLYDYGRPRELHLDHGVAVSNCEVQDSAEVGLPVESAYFRTHRLHVRGSAQVGPLSRNTIYIALHGHGLIAGEPFLPGDGFEIAAGTDAFEIVSPDATFLFTEAR
jgi:mannose-6-phosphate isomerase